MDSIIKKYHPELFDGSGTDTSIPSNYQIGMDIQEDMNENNNRLKISPRERNREHRLSFHQKRINVDEQI
jgi:hypothetical protein